LQISQRLRKGESVINMFILCRDITKLSLFVVYSNLTFFIFQGKLIVLIRVMFEKKIVNASKKLKERSHLETIFFFQ